MKTNKSSREINKERRKKRKERNEEKLFKQLELMEEEKKLSPQEETTTTERKKRKKSKVIQGPPSTISIALPGSILDNAQSRELRTYLAGQIARAASVFQIDEVIVFDENNEQNGDDNTKTCSVDEDDGLQMPRECCTQLARILQYLECPQYLRKHIFPIHKDLQYAGLLNPLDAPHHLRQTNSFVFREGIITNKPVKDGKIGSYADIGLPKNILVDKTLTPGIRVTVKLLPKKDDSKKKQRGEVVSPNVPRTETGTYWGYNVRLAHSFSQVFTKSPYKKGYDLTIGTSDKGTPVDEIGPIRYEHALIVFGGLEGLESALQNDRVFNENDPNVLFDRYLNVLPDQGSRTIRTEEAILITLTALKNKLIPKHPVVSANKINNYS